MSRSGSRHGSHSHSHHFSSRSHTRHRHQRDYERCPPVSMFNNIDPFSVGSSSRRESFSGGFSSHHPVQEEIRPSFSGHGSRSRHGSSSRHDDDRSLFDNPSCSSSHPRSGSRSYTYEYDDDPVRAPSGRRGATDLSSTTHDLYDPFDGQLGTGRRHGSIYGDPELPRYRSASAYHRYISRAPDYDAPDCSLRGSQGLPPPYASFSSQGGREPPMQYPATRRSSHYDRFDGGLPPLDYFSRKGWR